MMQPTFVQVPFVGGLDEKTASTYLDPEQNQAAILNGSFRYVGRVDKRYGIQADRALASTTLLNPNGIADPYVSPASYATALGGLGDLVLQGSWAWLESGAVSSYAGKLPNVDVVRRPLPVRSVALPLICDGVTSLQGTVRAIAWVGEPQNPIGTSIFQIESAFLDPDTSTRVLSFPTLNITAKNVTPISLVWFPLTGVLTLFVVVEAAASASRELRAYIVTPANNDNTWTIQAGATLGLWNDDLTCLDVQPMSGDPNSGYVVLYLPTGAATTLNWRYFRAFASFASGALAVGTIPGNFPCHIVADWGIDVALVWSDNPGFGDHLHIDYLSADGLFTALATYDAAPIATPALGSFAYADWFLGGACRVYDKTNATLNSEIYLAFWAADHTNFANGGPFMPVTMGGLVARSAVATVTPMGFVYYPYGLRPLSRPAQMLDGAQIVGSYAHISHPCVQDFMMFLSSGVPISSVTAATPISQQVTEYLVDFRVRAQVGVPLAISSSQATIVATVAPRQLDPYLERWSDGRFLQPCISSDGLKLLTPVALLGGGVAGIGADNAIMWLAEFSVATQPQVATINGTAEIAGAVVMRAGPPIVEHGFTNFPEFITAVAGAAGTPNGTYSYAVVYARADRYGNIERSSPAILAAPVALANQKGSLTFPKLGWTNDAGANPNGNYFIEIYRTLTLGSTYYLLDRIDPGNLGAGPYGSYTDNTTDAVLQKASILYTTGGVLDHVNPPAASLACVHRGRLAIVDETRTNVWFTQTETAGEVLGFNEELIQPFIEGGDTVAIASLDDKFVAYKADSIYVMFGDGPADTGQGSDWTAPQRVPSDVGCSSAASVLTVPQGQIFLSSVGFHLLGRDLQVAYIGKGVQDTVKTYPMCISACVVPKAKQARWVMTDGVNQRVLCFDYFLNVWTVHQYAHLDSAIVQIYLDADDVYTVLTVNGGRYKESSTSWLDTDFAAVSYFVPTSITLPWLKVSGPQSYMMCRGIQFYGERKDASGLQLQLCYNYNTTVRKTAVWNNETRSQFWTHSPAPYAKCEAVQVLVTDVDSAQKTTGQGFTFDSMGFDLVKIGERYRRMPARAKA